MKRTLVLLAILVGIVAFSASASAQVIFSHPYDFESTNAYTSSYNYYESHQSYADYYTDGSFTMTDFHWWGVSEYSNDDIDGFWFQIYGDNPTNGYPGTLLYEEWIGGAANATTTGDDVAGFEVFSYSMDLTNPFEITGGHYWFSVYAITDYENWYWALGDDILWDEDWQYTNLDTWNHLENNDFAYEITGYRDVVPEPATLTLLGLGLLGMAARRRRK